MLRYKSKSNSRRGFSLTEMSVVLVAVAAVVVVTVGSSGMVQKTKVGSLLTDIKNFSNAVTTFEGKYKAIPGDFANAYSIWGASCGASAAACNGNGNGSIDSAQESLKFWQHLALAGMIRGKYDGSSTHVPGVGVPASSIKPGGYTALNASSDSIVLRAPVVPFPNQAIVIEAAGFVSGVSSAGSIVTPEDAKYLDEKIDDGMPNTGILQASGIGTDCQTGTTISDTYNISSKKVACRLRFIIRKSTQASDSVSLSGTCNQIGLIRRSENVSDVCPIGTMGKIMKTCRLNAANEGSWQKSQNHCVPITCYGEKRYGEKRTLPCLNGQVGIGTTQTCSSEGVWVNDSTNCTFVHDAAACTTGEVRQPLACNWGQTGSVIQTCTDSLWVDNNTCSTIQCSGGVDVGGTRTYASGCGTNYLGTATETCMMDGTWKITSNRCVPKIYTTTNCSSIGMADVDIGCPPGETGNHFQRCVATGTPGIWITNSDTCEPIKCSGERIGTTRVVKDVACPGGRSGVVVEVCESDGATPPKGRWTASYTNCTAAKCDGQDQAGFAIWPYAVAGTTSVTSTCLPGYTGTPPTRNCGADSKWGSVTGACTRIQCPSTTSSGDNASWPAADSLSQNVVGTCSAGYVGLALRDCNVDGTWSTSKATCGLPWTPLPVTAGLRLWLDANETSTLFTSSACTGTPANLAEVRCWKDKSGNAYDATTQYSPSPYLNIGAQNGKSVVGYTPSSPGRTINGSKNLLENGDIPYSVFISARTSWSSPAAYGGFVNLLGIMNGLDHRFVSFSLEMQNRRIADSWGNADSEILYSSMNSINDSARYVFVFTYDNTVGVGRKIYINGTLAASNTNTNRNGLQTGAFYVGSYMQGSMNEVIVYNVALNTTDRKSTECYLGTKWGVTIAGCP